MPQPTPCERAFGSDGPSGDRRWDWARLRLALGGIPIRVDPSLPPGVVLIHNVLEPEKSVALHNVRLPEPGTVGE